MLHPGPGRPSATKKDKIEVGGLTDQFSMYNLSLPSLAAASAARLASLVIQDHEQTNKTTLQSVELPKEGKWSPIPTWDVVI